MRFLLRPICWAKGHKRGHYFADSDTHKLYRCPRCHRETRYKVKPNGRSNGTPGDES